MRTNGKNPKCKCGHGLLKHNPTFGECMFNKCGCPIFTDKKTGKGALEV